MTTASLLRRAAVVATTTMLAACAGGSATVAPAAAPALAQASAFSLSRAEIDAIVASPDRSDADRRNDERRKPAEMLAFIGLRPGMAVLDLSAGGGYTTELLARAVGPTGTAYGQSRPPPPPSPVAVASSAPPRRTTAMALAERAKKPGAANIVAVVQPFENPAPAGRATAGLDVVTLMFNYHDITYLPVDRAAMNAAVFRALKPGGAYVVADHSGRPGTGLSEAPTLHRIEEAFLRREVEAAGFKLAAEGMFLRNPADPRDREEPEPAMPKDEFVLRFVKP
jgi:predicted methyltransferase